MKFRNYCSVQPCGVAIWSVHVMFCSSSRPHTVGQTHWASGSGRSESTPSGKLLSLITLYSCCFTAYVLYLDS